LALAELNYTEINTVEILNRAFEVQDQYLPLPDFGNEPVSSSNITEVDDQGDVQFANDKSSGTEEVETNIDSSVSPVAKISKIDARKRKKKRSRNADEPGMLVSHPFGTIRGHTGFLTFARKPVLSKVLAHQ
jgi:hypothetical protein